jgi:glycosyltransferase involved in cell wall biosynthesis
MTNIGGAEIYLITLAVEQAKKGNSVHVVTTGTAPSIRKILERAGVQIHLLRRFRPYSPGSKGTSYIKKTTFHSMDIIDSLFRKDLRTISKVENIDAIHWHRFQGIGLSARALTNYTQVMTVHDHSLIDPSSTSIPSVTRQIRSLRMRFFRNSSKHINLLIFPSIRILRRHQENKFLEYSKPSFALLSHGWVLPEGRLDLSETQRSKSETKFLYAGSLSIEKGVVLLLDAWESLNLENATLTIAGDGPLLDLVKSKANRNIDYVGWVEAEDKAQLFAEHDVVIVPSLVEEVFNLVVAEAALSGRAIICSSAARPAYLEDLKSCLEFNQNDGRSLKRSIENLHSTIEKRELLAANALQASTILDFDDHLSNIMKIYNEQSQSQL